MPAASRSVNAPRWCIFLATWNRLAPRIRVLSTSKNAASPGCGAATGLVTTATYLSTGMDSSLVNPQARRRRVTGQRQRGYG